MQTLDELIEQLQVYVDMYEMGDKPVQFVAHDRECVIGHISATVDYVPPHDCTDLKIVLFDRAMVARISVLPPTSEVQ